MSESLSSLLAELLAADEEYDAAEREWDLLGPDGLGERDTRSANCPEFERFMAASQRRHDAMKAAQSRPEAELPEVTDDAVERALAEIGDFQFCPKLTDRKAAMRAAFEAAFPRICGDVTDTAVQKALDAQPFTEENYGTRVWQTFLPEYQEHLCKQIMRAALQAAYGQQCAATRPANASAIPQFRIRGCSDWYDGYPDTSDGKDWETRTLYTRPAEVGGDGWLPIESAPKDGTHVLGRSSAYGRPFVVFWGSAAIEQGPMPALPDGSVLEGNWLISNAENCASILYYPEEWMPFPK